MQPYALVYAHHTFVHMHKIEKVKQGKIVGREDREMEKESTQRLWKKMLQVILALWNLIVLDELGQATYTIFACFLPGKTDVVIVVRVKRNDVCEWTHNGTVHWWMDQFSFLPLHQQGYPQKELQFFIFLSL